MARTEGLARQRVGRLLTDQESAGRVAPFVAIMALGFLMIPLPPRVENPWAVAVAACLTLAILAGGSWTPWERAPRWTQLIPMLACLGVVALLREGEGGAASAEAPLTLLPVFWCALYGTRGQLAVVTAGVASVFIVPAAVVGGPRYPVTEWERAVVWTATSSIVGLTVQGLVQRINQQADQLRMLAHTDALTGLANLRHWNEALRVEIDRAARTGVTFALVVLDLDDFKGFNDRHGHPAADRLLKEMTASWMSALRRSDTLARLGGDEFGVLLVGVNLDQAHAVVERLSALVPSGQTVSAGLVLGDGSESEDDLVCRADESLYLAKAAKRPAALQV